MVVKLMRGIVTSLFVLSMGNAQASPVVVQSGSVYSGILGLSVGALTYDISFIYGSYNSTYGARFPTFLNNRAGAYDAALAIQSAMNTVPYLSIDPNQPYWNSSYFVPYAYDSDNDEMRFFNIDGNPDFLFNRLLDATWEISVNGNYVDPHYQWVSFLPAGEGIVSLGGSGQTNVPEPATFALFVMALAGLGATRRKTI